MSNFQLASLDWLSSPIPDRMPALNDLQYQSRIDALRLRMDSERFDICLVYGDREHFANLHFFTGFDPRFEEALLIVTAGKPVRILVGNECQAYVPVSPLWKVGQLRMDVFRPFSLEDQNREMPVSLGEILREEGCGPHSRVALVGSKTYAKESQSDIPSYIVDAARDIAGAQNCLNRSGWLVDSQSGLRTRLTAEDIAIFEINNVKASEAMRRMHFALRPGITDHQLLSETVHYDGSPLSCHMTCKTGPNRISLASASGNIIERGHTWSANVAYWGSNVCRANWIAEGPSDLPVAAQDYLEAFVGPYFLAMAEWLESISVGAQCAPIYERMHELLPEDVFHVELNPGHHIGYDEWPSAPFYGGSKAVLQSGMVLQSDVIPSNKTYFSTRMEDGYALADESLRTELRTKFPGCWDRMEARRRFMSQQLGIHLQDSVLPLSNCGGIIAPWGLRPEQVLIRS
jgi:hypothetical protein